MKFRRRQYLFIFTAGFVCSFLFLFSCASKQNQLTDSRKIAPEKDSLQLVPHSGIEFEVEIKGRSAMGTEMQGFVYNKSKDTVHYITETCYSLQPFLRFDSENFASITGWECVANGAAVKALNPGDTIRFEAIFFDREHNRSPERIGLDFRTVNKALNENEQVENRLAISRLGDAPTRKEDVIWVDIPVE